MSEKLEILVDKYMSLQEDKVFNSGVEEQYKSVYIDATKKRLIQEIYDEVKEEVRDAAVLEAQHIIDDKAGMKRIDEFRKLMLDGFLVAIFVGLFVNQCTDFIGYFKGSVTLDSVWSTIFIACAFFIICIGIFGWVFITELIKLIKKGKNDETD
jgi:hypothetical protein